MGIKGLCRFLHNKYPQVYERIHITEYAYQKIAIDISVYMYKYRSRRGINWLGSFINLVACLRKNQIHCVFVYDNGAVPEKQRTKDERTSQRQKDRDRELALENALENYSTDVDIYDNLVALYHEIRIKDFTPARMLGPSPIVKEQDVIGVCRSELSRLQNTYPKHEDFILTKKLFDILKVPWINAPLEAETTCSDLCRQGLVDGVLSEDSDVIAYGAPVLLPGFDTNTGECDRVCYENVLSALGMTSDMFLDFCIMCGTDYNVNIPGRGPADAFKLIQAYKSIDAIRDDAKIDVAILNHVRGRELFKNYEKTVITIPYCAQPDFVELQAFMNEHNINMSMDKLRESFAHEKIVFEIED